jgi:hypothetical protein
MDLHMLPYVYFNETVLQFIDDIQSIYPHDAKLKVAKSMAIAYTMSQKKGLQEAFAGLVQTRRAHITTRDSGHLFNSIKNEDVGGGDWMDIIRSRWMTMDQQNMDIAWKYLDQLLKLNDVCVVTR